VMALNAGATGRVVPRQRKTYDRLVLSAGLSGTIESVELPLRRGHRELATVRVGGQVTQWRGSAGAMSARVRVAGADRLEVVYASGRTDLTEAALGGVKFLGGDLSPTFRVRHAADEDSELLARRFVEFFRSYVAIEKGVRDPSAYEMSFDVAATPKLPSRTILVLADGASESLFDQSMTKQRTFISGKPSDGLIVLSGGSFEGLQQAVYDLMNVLNATSFRRYISRMSGLGVTGLRLHLLPHEKAMFE